MIDVTTEEKELYEQIYSLSLKKKATIIKGDVDLLKNTVEDEQSLLEKACEIEERRQRLSEELFERHGIPRDKRIVDRLAEHENEADGQKLLDISSELRQIVNRQKRVNDINRKLINTQLEYLELSLDSILRNNLDSDEYKNYDDIEEKNNTENNQFSDESKRLGLIDREI